MTLVRLDEKDREIAKKLLYKFYKKYIWGSYHLREDRKEERNRGNHKWR